MLIEADAFLCQSVDVRRFDKPLAIGSEFGMAEIVRKNVNDVGWTFVLVHICRKGISTKE
jgi:hypothetical protein